MSSTWPFLEVGGGAVEQLPRLLLRQGVGEGVARRGRIGGEHLMQQAVVQFAVEHQPHVKADVFYLGEQIASLRVGDGLFDVFLAAFGSTAERGWQQTKQDTE